MALLDEENQKGYCYKDNELFFAGQNSGTESGSLSSAGMRVGNKKRFVYSKLICQLVAVLSVIGIIATTLALNQQVRAYQVVFQYYLGSTYGWGTTYTGTPPTYSSALFYDRFCYHLVIPTSSALQDLCTDFPPYTAGLVVFSLLLVAAIASYLVLRRKKSKRV